jgi:chromosome segregation ATPase
MMHVIGVYADGRVARTEARTEKELQTQHESLQRSGAHVSIVPDDCAGTSTDTAALDSHKQDTKSMLDSFQAQITQNAQAVSDLASQVSSMGAEIARLKNPSTV